MMWSELRSFQQGIEISEMADDVSNLVRSLDVFLINQVRIFDDLIVCSGNNLSNTARTQRGFLAVNFAVRNRKVFLRTKVLRTPSCRAVIRKY